MSFCWECGEEVEEEKKEGEDVALKKTKHKARGRRCKKCKNAAVVKRRHNNPCASLQHRLYNTFHRMWPNASSELWSMNTVRMVWERCEKKSVISGETNPQHLCISYKHKPSEKDEPPTIDDLVVMTTKEAQILAHCKSWDRITKFDELKNKTN